MRGEQRERGARVIMCPLSCSLPCMCVAVTEWGGLFDNSCVCVLGGAVFRRTVSTRACVLCLGESEREFAIGVAGGAERKIEASRERGEREQRDESCGVVEGSCGCVAGPDCLTRVRAVYYSVAVVWRGVADTRCVRDGICFRPLKTVTSQQTQQPDLPSPSSSGPGLPGRCSCCCGMHLARCSLQRATPTFRFAAFLAALHRSSSSTE